MSMLLLALAIAAPTAAAAQERPPATPAAREAMAGFARCVVARSPEKAHSALTMDFRTREYRSALRALSTNNRDCFRSRTTMRAGGLPFAAAMAEALLRRGAAPLNLRLLRAAQSEAPTFAPTDRIAMCVARSDPDNAAALLTAPIASESERNAAAALGTAVGRCTPPGFAVQLDPYALRSIVATASYRLLSPATTGTERG